VNSTTTVDYVAAVNAYNFAVGEAGLDYFQRIGVVWVIISGRQNYRVANVKVGIGDRGFFAGFCARRLVFKIYMGHWQFNYLKWLAL
jgi:hypothetical protein